MSRAYLKLCEKARLPVDAIGHWPAVEQPAVVMERLRRYKAARGYTVSGIAAILEAERNKPPTVGVRIDAPGLSHAAAKFWNEKETK